MLQLILTALLIIVLLPLAAIVVVMFWRYILCCALSVVVMFYVLVYWTEHVRVEREAEQHKAVSTACAPGHMGRELHLQTHAFDDFCFKNVNEQ